MGIDKDMILSDISNHLILNAPNMSNLGLFRGKMGVIIFFYVYSRHTEMSYYSDFADLLLDDIYSELDVSLPVTLGDGLSGIGWGIEYLVQNNYIEGDTYDILADINTIIMQKINIYRSQDFSLETGLMGILYYVLTHLTSFARNKTIHPFDRLFLLDLLNTIEKQKLNMKQHQLFIDYREYMNNAYLKQDKISLPSFLIESIDLSENYLQRSLGLHDGLAGVGLKFIL